MTSTTSRSILSSAILGLATGGTALAQDDLTAVSFGTNWVAQAEHGGFYQSVADGTYAECGLDVSIVPGGPQVNNRALMMAGRNDFNMGSSMLEPFNAASEGIPVVTVATSFQKHPQVLLTHPDRVDGFEGLKELTLLIGDTGNMSYYQWMIEEYGFAPEQREPYTFNPAPFLADEDMAMQGYITSEPYLIENEAGWTPDVYSLAEAGYTTYANTIETMQATIDERPEVVRCFVDGSAKGWYNFLYGDNSAARELIMSDNPDMSADKIDFAIETIKDAGLVDSGDALEGGIGVITEAQVKDFFDKMVAAGVVAEDLDWQAAFTTEFVGEGVGMDLKPAQ